MTLSAKKRERIRQLLAEGWSERDVRDEIRSLEKRIASNEAFARELERSGSRRPHAPRVLDQRGRRVGISRVPRHGILPKLAGARKPGDERLGGQRA